jgi:hypothetical protein
MNLIETLKTYQKQMVEEWIHRLHTEVSERYSNRPLNELFRTVSKANEANYAIPKSLVVSEDKQPDNFEEYGF